MINPKVRESPILLELLREEPFFEVVAGKLQEPNSDATDRKIFEAAIVDTFVSSDAELSRPGDNHGILIGLVQDFLHRFARAVYGSGYLFTLNQDLWPKRFLYNHITSGSLPPALPGLQRTSEQRIFLGEPDVYSNRLVMKPSSNLSATVLRGAFNIIKLHGSFNWRTSDGRTLSS